MRTALALGFFDGVHIAHQKIISAAVDYAREHGLRAAALTFDRPSRASSSAPRRSLPKV